MILAVWNRDLLVEYPLTQRSRGNVNNMIDFIPDTNPHKFPLCNKTGPVRRLLHLGRLFDCPTWIRHNHSMGFHRNRRSVTLYSPICRFLNTICRFSIADANRHSRQSIFLSYHITPSISVRIRTLPPSSPSADLPSHTTTATLHVTGHTLAARTEPRGITPRPRRVVPPRDPAA